MAENKTTATEASVEGFIGSVDHPGKREDAKVLDALFRRVTGEEPKMWGPTIVGYGKYRYRYDSGHEGEICRTGFSPRKARHSLYISCNCHGEEDPRFSEALGRLGKWKRGNGGCLYVNKLSDIDIAVLEEMVRLGWENSLENYPD